MWGGRGDLYPVCLFLVLLYVVYIYICSIFANNGKAEMDHHSSKPFHKS